MSGVDLDGTVVEAVVVGGGQAGLATSHHLAAAGVAHLVLEARTAFCEWQRRRWDSFCLVTPNWQCRLPDWRYDGPDPDGFMTGPELREWFAGFRAMSGPPLVEGVSVTSLDPGPNGGFTLTTTAGRVMARQVVVATGPYAVPVVPAAAADLDPSVTQLHSGDYRSPDALPPGGVLVVGTGQSGCQIAEDLHGAGRQVHLATGSAPRVSRRHRGRDVVAWLDEMGHYARPVDDFGAAKRDNVNHYVSGRAGGHDIDLRALALEGMVLHGRLRSVDGARLTFADDLAANLDRADAVLVSINASIDAHIAASGIDAPPADPYVPPWEPAPGPTSLDLAAAGVGTVLWATGFRPDHSWVHAPAFDADGRVLHRRGITAVPGLHFVGLPWQHTWGSARLASVADDAAFVAASVAAAAVAEVA